MSGLSAAQQAVASSRSQSTANVGSVAANSATVNISQQAQTLAAASQASSLSSGNYDFTNMTPNEMGKLVSDGKITGWSFVLTEAQLQAGTRGLSGTALQAAWDAANNTPANYIQRITKGISDSKMYGIDTTGLESILKQMEALQGTPVTATSA
jgi:hypothetical protein